MPDSSPEEPPTTIICPTLPAIAIAFLTIGTFAFGGQSGLLALLERDLVTRRNWVTPAQIAEAFTFVQLLPGAVVVQVVAYLGWKLRGAWGTVVATAAFLLPSVLVMLILGIAYRTIAEMAGVRAALHGLTAAVLGLIAVAIWKQGHKTIPDFLMLLVAVAACVVSLVWHINPAILVAAAGIVGIVREAVRKSETVR